MGIALFGRAGMNILQLTPRMPWPLTDGGAIAVFNITKWLAILGHQVTLLTFPLDSPRETEEAVRELSRYATVHLVSKPLPPRWRVLLRTMFSGAYPVDRRNMPEMYDLCASIIRDNSFDIVHIDHAHMGPYGLWIKEHYGLPIILRENNFEAMIYERFARTERNPVKSFLARTHGRRLKWEEARFLTNFDAVAAISKEDVAAMKLVAPKGHYSIIPAGVDTEYFRPTQTEVDPNSILSIGSLAWDPNYDATRYFLNAIFPLILQSRPETVLHIIGASEERILPFAAPFGKSIQIHGKVKDMRDYLGRAAVLVVPLRIGGGMRLKLLEAFAAGKAIVSTSIGAEGNLAQDEIHLLIRDGAEEFSSGVLKLLGDAELRHSIGANARELAVSQYGWSHIVSEFVELYGRVLRDRAVVA
ncbi:MAG TPA: glycosyltransferase family 4 protein [Candidatus Kapabacteria bacterium]|nr:glycosyltransferase family 4 protein [Candidatus Kapabacteria bacterium]